MSLKTRDRIISFILATSDDAKIIIPRLIVGLVFLSEGIQKFIFPGVLGPGRFEKIGFGNPGFWAYFTAIFEIICGFSVLLGFMTRVASIPLLIIMITAFITTKWPILISHGFWPFAHEYRTDFSMTLLLIYLVISNGGRWSLNDLIFRSS